MEADIWLDTDLNGDQELFVGHEAKSLLRTRTLRSLYLDPLANILAHQNNASNSANDTTSTGRPTVGVFNESPNSTLVLLLGFKTNGTSTWPVVMFQLEAFRKMGWLTNWDPPKDW